jgi:hypothetical protein
MQICWQLEWHQNQECVFRVRKSVHDLKVKNSAQQKTKDNLTNGHIDMNPLKNVGFT